MHPESEGVKCWVMCAESCTIWGKMKIAFVVSLCNPNFRIKPMLYASVKTNLHLNDTLMKRGSHLTCHFSPICPIYLSENQSILVWLLISVPVFRWCCWHERNLHSNQSKDDVIFDLEIYIYVYQKKERPGSRSKLVENLTNLSCAQKNFYLCFSLDTILKLRM